MISPLLLKELRIILKEDYQLELSADELFETAMNLVNCFELLAKMSS